MIERKKKKKRGESGELGVIFCYGFCFCIFLFWALLNFPDFQFEDYACLFFSPKLFMELYYYTIIPFELFFYTIHLYFPPDFFYKHLTFSEDTLLFLFLFFGKILFQFLNSTNNSFFTLKLLKIFYFLCKLLKIFYFLSLNFIKNLFFIPKYFKKFFLSQFFAFKLLIKTLYKI